MAEPKKKTSKGRRDRRRSHDHAEPVLTKACVKCGAQKRPHTICKKCGTYST